VGVDRNIRHERPVVGVYHHDPEPYLPLIREIVPESYLRCCTHWDGLREHIGQIDVLLAFKFGFRPFPRDLILSAPHLEWVQLASAGIDHMTPFDPRRVVVTNASGIHGDVMSQYVIGALIHRLWDFPRLVRQQHARLWERYDVSSLTGWTMGIVGAGRVGSAIAARARAFGMRTIGVRRSGRSVEGFDRVTEPQRLPDLLAESDVVVITVPRTPETLNMIGRAELARMKPHAYIVNVSRGGIVDETALVEALERRAIGGAIVDVFAEEPLPTDSRFWTLENAFVTPHISSEFAEWPTAVARLFCANLRRWMDAEPLSNVVDPVAGY
jgi:phosphoglycerate dehydrogenase-like enzyme